MLNSLNHRSKSERITFTLFLKREHSRRTLEDLTKGTSIGHYALMGYGLILAIVGVGLLVVSLYMYHQHTKLVQQEVAKFYNIPLAGAEGAVCHNGMLHHQNVGFFSGGLAYSPVIKCSNNELQQMKGQEHRDVILLSMLMILIGLTMFVKEWLGLGERVKGV